MMKKIKDSILGVPKTTWGCHDRKIANPRSKRRESCAAVKKVAFPFKSVVTEMILFQTHTRER